MKTKIAFAAALLAATAAFAPQAFAQQSPKLTHEASQ